MVVLRTEENLLPLITHRCSGVVISPLPSLVSTGTMKEVLHEEE
jgi:hypothetical protein